MKRKYSGAEFSNVVLRLILKGRLRKEELDRVDEALDLINANVLLLQTVKDELHESMTSDLINSKFTENSFPVSYTHLTLPTILLV